MPRTRTQVCAVLFLPLLTGMAASSLLAPSDGEARDGAGAVAEPSGAPAAVGAAPDAEWLPQLPPVLQRFDPSAIDPPPLYPLLPASDGAGRIESPLAPVPEPSTGLLLGLGLCGIAALRRSSRG